jgi:hypothetical protein
MKSIRLAGVFAGLTVTLMLAGCGDVYRPVVIPNPVYTVDPALQGYVFTLNEGVQLNGNATSDGSTAIAGEPCTSHSSEPCLGTVSDIDVPGDVVVANHVVGRKPWTGLLIGSESFIANAGETGGSNASVPPSISAYSPLVTGNEPITTLMPAVPFAITARGLSWMYAALGNGQLGVINIAIGTVLTQQQPVDSTPVSVVELPDASKVYVVDQGTKSVRVFSTNGPTEINSGISLDVANPVWAVASPDSKFVFVLGYGDSTTGARVDVIDTATDSLVTLNPDTNPVTSVSVGASVPMCSSATPPPQPCIPNTPLQNPMIYDTISGNPNGPHRLFVANPGDDKVYYLNTDNLTTANPSIAVGAIPLESGTGPFSIALAHISTSPDLLNVYALGSTSVPWFQLNSGITPTNLSSVKVAQSIAADGKVFSPSSPRAIVASADGTKVYVANHDPKYETDTNTNTSVIVQQPGTSIIRTSNNTLDGTYIRAPFQDQVNCQFDTPQEWMAGHAYTAGDTIMPSTDPNNPGSTQAYQATTSGTSGDNNSAFYAGGSGTQLACTGDATSTLNPSSCTLTDGGVTWRPIGAPQFCPRQRPTFLYAQP